MKRFRVAWSAWLLVPLVVMAAAIGQEKAEPRDVSFVAAVDKTEQKYVLVLPQGFRAAEKRDLLIALHGHGSDRWQVIRTERSEWKATRDAAARHNMILVSPDYRAATSWMGPKAEADVAQIIGDLKKEYRVGKVIVCGASMGGASCLTFAVRRPELVDGVASMNGTANHLEYEQFQDAIRASFGGTKAEVPLEYKNRSAEYWPEKLTMPVGLAVGGKDQDVPPESVVRLAGVLKQLKRPVLLVYRDPGGHSTNYEDATAILEFAIQGKAPTSSTAPASAPAFAPAFAPASAPAPARANAPARMIRRAEPAPAAE